MKVYELRPDYSYQSFSFINEAEDRGFWIFQDIFWGEPVGHIWQRFRVTVPLEYKHLPPCDFPSLLPDVPVFSRRAVEILQQFIQPYGEFLPLQYGHGEYYVFNVTNWIDALNEIHSDESRISEGKIVLVKRYNFKPEQIKDEYIFKIPQERARIYVTDAFVDIVKRHGLTGFNFERLWSFST